MTDQLDAPPQLETGIAPWKLVLTGAGITLLAVVTVVVTMSKWNESNSSPATTVANWNRGADVGSKLDDVWNDLSVMEKGIHNDALTSATCSRLGKSVDTVEQTLPSPDRDLNREVHGLDMSLGRVADACVSYADDGETTAFISALKDAQTYADPVKAVLKRNGIASAGFNR